MMTIKLPTDIQNLKFWLPKPKYNLSVEKEEK